MERSDEELMERVKAGDRGAFETLVERHEKPLFNFLRRMVGERALAEDLFQETFLRLFRAAGSFDPARRLSPWLYQIASHLCLDALKKKRPLSLGETGLPAEGGITEPPSPFPSPEEEVGERERAAQVREALASLPEEQREVLVLRHYQGLSYQEIGRALKLPLGTVKSRMHQALVHLRDQLAAQEIVEKRRKGMRKMHCRRVRGQLTHYIYGELNPAEALSLRRHLEACPGCRAELSSLERTFEALEAWEEVSPGPELRQRLRVRLAREPLPAPAEIVHREAEAWGTILKLLGAVASGILSALVLFFLLGGGTSTNGLLPQVLSACGIFWAGSLSLLYFLALNGGRELRLEVGGREVWLDLRLIASMALLALGGAAALATATLYLFPQLLGALPLQSIGEEVPALVLYLFLSGGLTLALLLVGGLLLGHRLRGSPVANGLLAGGVFCLLVAPGITALCLPLTLGLYLGLLGGSILGALSGGALACWLAMRRAQALA